MPERVLHIDIETRSDIDLSKAGVYPYSESPQFEILLVAAAIDDGEIACFDLASGGVLPEWFLQALNDQSYTKVAHNASFERVCFSRLLSGRKSYTFLDPSQWHCTMVHAAMLGLPFSLDGVAKVLGTGEQKDKAGTDLIKYFCVPCKPTESNGHRTCNNPADAPEKWQSFKDYCIQDVATERDIYHRLQRFPIPESERLVYILDQQINDRGVLIDLQMVEQAIKCDLLHSEILTRRAYELTSLENPNSVSQLKMWLEERGLSMDTLGKKQVAAQIRNLDKNGCDAELLEMLKLRLQMAKSSVKKYQAAERAVSADGRARGMFRYYGANHTGRWSGKNIMLHNLPQNHLSTLDEARELLKLGAFVMLEMLYGNTPDTLSQLIRTMLVPKAGCEFVVADFSAIEARVLAWLAGERWRLESFRSGADIYCASASQMFGVPVVKNGVNGELRQKGKVAELACIAEDQLVLTNSGYRPIQSVTKSMLVWDGRAWVKHSGVVRRGIRRTMTFEGLTATPDHLVWNGYRFVPFEYYAAMKDSTNGGRDIIYSGLHRVYDIKNCGPRHQYVVSGHIVHNCGYGGAAGALIAMGALDMGLKESELPDLISDWRSANPRIVQYWWDVDKAATDTVKTGNLNKVGLIAFERYAGELFITIPSGRKLAYASPRLEPNRFGRMGINYMGIGTNNKWQRLETYGPKVVENIVQATARDLLAEAMLRVRGAGYDIILHCHDEMCVEVPKGNLTVDALCSLMSVNPSWAEGLPLSAAGYRCPYYQKD